jgi:hypothetical protein
MAALVIAVLVGFGREARDIRMGAERPAINADRSAIKSAATDLPK